MLFLNIEPLCNSTLKDESFRIGLVNALEDPGDPDAALAEIKEAIRIWPDDSYFHYLFSANIALPSGLTEAIRNAMPPMNDWDCNLRSEPAATLD